MKSFVFAVVFVLTSFTIGFAQEPTTRMERVPGLGSFTMTPADFEKLEYAANVDRFDKITDKEKRDHLDIYTSLISSENKTIEFVIRLKGDLAANVGPNMDFIYRYLTKNKKIMPHRISFALNAAGANDTELWLVPNKNVSVPSCPECIVISAEDAEKLKEFFPVKKSGK